MKNPAKRKIIPIMKGGFTNGADRSDRSIRVPRFHTVRTIPPIMTQTTPSPRRDIHMFIHREITVMT